jgi:hypothetical protein
MSGFALVHEQDFLYRRARLLQHRVVGPLVLTEADYANLSLLESPALRRRLATATRVWSDAMPPDVVTMNSRVLCSDADNGERRVLSVVYPADADEKAGLFSVVSDAGLALLGARARQSIEWRRPDGAVQKVRVEAVLYQPEHDLREKLIFLRGSAA